MRCIAGREWGADRRTLLRLYTSLIRPILDYNGFLYDDIATKKIDSLQVIQNTALRIITGAMKTSNIDNLHIDVNIPTLDRRRKYLLLRFYLRCCANPSNPSNQILTNRYSSSPPSDPERRFPVISYRVEKALNHFNISFPSILPIPPLTSFWLAPIQNVDRLFSENKKHISSQEISQLFIQYVNQYNDHTFFYTDGSLSNGKTGAGVTSKVYENSIRLHNLFTVFSAELSAILLAIIYINKQHIQKSVICTDSASAVSAISSRKKEDNHIIYIIKKHIITIQKQGFEFRLLWIPGHAGIPGNTRADLLAKNSLDKPERNTLRCPHKDIANHIQNALLDLRQFDWNSFPNQHLHPIHPKIKSFASSNQSNRLRETVLARLRIGHTSITHRYIYQHEPPPTCPHCTPLTRLNIAHLLLNCPHYDQYRQPIIHYTNTHNLSLDLPTLLGDDHPDLIELLFTFLSDSNLINSI
ncbi:uncharacterized protein LOC122385530 [Amphibalanus amphitrite]|uniref:uncharacterized protein LOC122385530 n=1 Tax=Amphibalanus amphitrite TaxID=1232801 RepID=UPI001C916C89|nr:uncharacterized protein LOC122385530 [Amphibalanus amphitrite]